MKEILLSYFCSISDKVNTEESRGGVRGGGTDGITFKGGQTLITHRYFARRKSKYDQ